MGLKAGNIVVIGHPELAGFPSAPVPAPEPTPVVEEVKEEVVEEKIETTSISEEVEEKVFNSIQKGSQYMDDLLNGGDFLLFDKFINNSSIS